MNDTLKRIGENCATKFLGTISWILGIWSGNKIVDYLDEKWPNNHHIGDSRNKDRKRNRKHKKDGGKTVL